MNTGRPISEDDLHAYVDNALDTSRHAAVKSYLDSHPEVARRVEGFVTQRQMLRSAFGPIAHEPVPPQLSLARMIDNRRLPSFSPWRSTAAAIALLMIGAGGGWFSRGFSQVPNSGILSLAKEASDSYGVFGPDRTRPVEIRAEDSAQLVEWVSQRLNHQIAVPNLAPAGYRFMGGRLVPTGHGPAGLFMYDDDRGTRLVMLVRPMESDRNAPMTQMLSGTLAGFTWAQNGIGFSLVGAITPETLHPLADEIRRQSSKDI